MSRWNLAWLLGIPAFIVLGLTLSFRAPAREKGQDYRLMQLLAEVLAQVEQNYVRELTQEERKQLVEDMINGGLEKLDRYSAYYNEKEYTQFNRTSTGNFAGIGIEVGVDRATGLLQVISPMVGTPAYKEGVRAGDLILKIDNTSTENMRMDKAVELITGKPGTSVRLTLVHEGTKEPVELTIGRAKIEIPSVLGDSRNPAKLEEWELLIDKENKIGYIRLVGFSKPTVPDLRKALTELERQGVRGFVLDLRGNPGGLLESAVEVSNLFLTGGKRIVSTRDRKGEREVFDSKPDKAMLEPATLHPMAVLIDRNSASASEIVAAALQDNGRAVIVGERSYGKGSVQNIIGFPRDAPHDEWTSALKLTTASYWRPSGKNIHRQNNSKETDDWGVKPNESLDIHLKDDERMKYLVDRRHRDKVPPPKPDAKPFVDRVLQKALDYVRAEQVKAK